MLNKKGSKQLMHKDKKAFANFILKYVYEKGRPIELGDLFLEILPNTGIDYFREILDELVDKKWLIKREEEKGTVPGMPFLVTMKITYNISLDGINYLSSRSPIGFVTNFIKNNIKWTISISTIATISILGSTSYFTNTEKSSLSNDSLLRESSSKTDSLVIRSEIKLKQP